MSKQPSKQPASEGLEPVAEADALALPARPRNLPAGLRLNIRGRSVRLRGLRKPPRGLLRWLLILGPGLVAASAGNDAGGIATYSSAGAQYGYDLIWVMVVITVSLAVVQEMCARLGAATGRGLFDLIRERFGVGWTLFAVAVVLVANGGLVVSEFVGVGAAAELLGVSRYVAVPVAAALLWYLVIFGSYDWVEKIFLLMTLVFFAYPVAAFMGRPDWHEVARGAFVPVIKRDPDYIFILVGLLGTTITPYMQLFQQSSLVEKGVARRHYGPERIDTYTGAVFSNLMSIAMIVATAATLHVAGQTHVETAEDAAKALAPLLGAYAKILFGAGLLGASLLAGAVLPLATSYAISEAFGLPKGVNLDFRRAPKFFTLFTALVVFGAGVALIPGVPVIRLLVAIQVLNGALLPVILVFILVLINDARLTGQLKNTPLYNVLGWGTFALITTAVAVLLGGQLLSLFGVKIFGG
ncbi:MAG: Nramp family divalent metal transporter [Acidobacteriota bacterium]|nr:Nramp family divalent metal transporter [Acidobacteriota bacterium]MDQ5836417.1 Nramp family divalent metal transporter [Acidobacteriota bacterium]